MFPVEFIQNHPTLTLIIVVLTAVLWQLKRDKRIKNFASRIPGPRQYPFIGAALEIVVPREEVCKLQFKHAKLYGRRYMIRLGPSHYFVVSNATDIEKILSSSVHISKGELYGFIMPWLGEGLLTSQGKKWQRRRKMLTPAFHFKILEDFMVVFNENAGILVDILEKEFLNAQTPKDIFPYITRCALDIICETAMDRKIDAQRQRDTPYVLAVYQLCELLVYRAFRPWFNNNFIWGLTKKGREWNGCLKTLHSFTEQVIRERKAAQDEGTATSKEQVASDVQDDIYWRGKKRLAFLDLLLDAQKNPENELSDLDIREEVDTFMFEGHDTTAASMGWTLFLLACYPEHQAKVIEELESIFGDDRTRPATSEDLTKMKYLELCIKESLRLYPSVPFISRYLHTDLVLDDDTIVPAGINMVLLSLQIHRNEAVFPEPELFMPERFLPENISNRHPFSYIPFSAGPRNCIGQKFALMEEKVVLSTIFRNFVIEAAERIEDVVVMAEVITRPRDGFKVKLRRLDAESKAKLTASHRPTKTVRFE